MGIFYYDIIKKCSQTKYLLERKKIWKFAQFFWEKVNNILEKIVDLEHSVEAAARKYAQLDKEKKEIETERDSVMHEISNLRNYVEETKALVERERAERERFQVTSQSVRRVQEEARIEIQNKELHNHLPSQNNLNYPGNAIVFVQLDFHYFPHH